MKYFIQKPLVTLSISVLSFLLITGVQAATFSKLMKLGIVDSNSFGKEVVIYNNDQTKCLSTYGRQRSGIKSLVYATCRMDGSDTWLITSTGKIKNKRNGKCLSSPKLKDNLVLTRCSFMYSRNKSAYDFIILDQLTDRDGEGIEVADIRN